MTQLEEPILRWAADAVAPGARVVDVVALRQPFGPWRLSIEASEVIDVILKVRPLDWRTEVRTEVAALRFTERHGLPTPRLLATTSDDRLGAIGFLTSCLPGTSTIPVDVDVARLRASGAAAARIHRVAASATDDLPLRTRQMPWIDFSEERRAGRSPSTPLLRDVDGFLARTEAPRGPCVLVHGDLWQGNVLYADDRCTGIVDWEAAGVGHPGIDIGSLRWDAAILYDLHAANHVVEGWEAESGEPASDLAFWDLVAAANTPADLGPMVDAIAQQGRPDLDGKTLTARRDRFVEDALERSRSDPGGHT